MPLRSARSPLASFAVLSLLISVAGCKCDQVITRTNGELGVVWRNGSGERIVNRDATYDFGNALAGERRTMTMTVRNTGANRITLAKLERSEGDEAVIGKMPLNGTETSAFELEFDTLTLEPSEQRDLNIAFTPKGLKGTYLSKLVLTAEGTRLEDSTAIITLLGKGEKGACDLPDVIDFGKTPVGETLPFTVEFLNPTSIPTSGTAGSISGADASSFGYGAGSPTGTVPVGAMSKTEVVVTFSPTELRAYQAQVVMRGAGECPEKTVLLKGVGSNETLSWSPTSIAYGYVNPGSETLRDVVFINPASVPVVLTQVTSTNPADFYHAVAAGTDATRFVVPPNGVPTPMKIACNPSMLGARTGTVTFNTPLRNPASGAITLTCTGGGPRIKVSPRPTLAFGRVGFFPGNTTFTVQRKINIQNIGSRPPMMDRTANLFLGEVAPDGTPGQIPLFVPTPGTGTSATEFSIALGSSYSQTDGLQAIAGLNFVDLVVTLRPESVGMKTMTVRINSNDPAEPAIDVDVTADVQMVPPCTILTSPSSANFGLVTPGTTKDLPITISNPSVTQGDVCYLSGIELGAGSDLAYSIVGGNIVEKELQPQQSFQVVVRVAPTGAPPANLQTLTGQLVFNSTSAARPQVSIPLRTSVGPACLTVTPDPMDFGTVKVGCNSASRTFNIYNTCTAPITLTQFSMQAAGGQPPGGPNCMGTSPCPEFHLTSTPNVGSGLTLNPGGGAPVTFQARYGPIDVGSDSGAVAIDAIQNGQSITYLVGLQGRGDTTGLQIDTYTQDLQPKADILLVIDDSGSMADKQSALANNFNNFIQYAVAASVDYQIGVTTTTEDDMECLPPPFGCVSVSSKGSHGKLVKDGPTGLKFVKPTTPGVSSVFSRLVNVGTNGSGGETALATSVLALTPPNISTENAGFVRPDANLAVVVISDASDQSTQPVSYYQNLLVNVKGFQRLTYFTFSAVTPRLANAPGNCTYDEMGANSARYDPIVQFTSGVSDEICNANWATTLQNLGRTVFGFRTQFYLNNQPDQSAAQIVVKVNGVVVPPGPTTWTYDSASNSINFSTSNVPAPGVPFEFQYVQSCF